MSVVKASCVNRVQTSHRSARVRLAVAALAVSGAWAATAADRYSGPAGFGPADGGNGFLNTTDATWASNLAGASYGPFAASGDVAIYSNPGAVLVNGNTSTAGMTVGGNTFLRRVNVAPTTTPATLSLTGTTTVPAGSYLAVRNDANFTGGINVTGGGIFAIGGASTATTGTVNVAGGSTLFYYNDAGGIADTQPVNVAAGAFIEHGLVNDTYGPLSGGGTIRGSYSGMGVAAGPVVRVNTNGANSTFSGAIQGRGVRLTKLGAGTLTLSGTNTFTSHTSLTQGTLRLTGGQALADASPVYFGSTAGNNAQLVVESSETIGMLAGGNQENGLTTIPAGVSLTVNQTKPYSLFNGAFSGTGTFIKDGPGVMAIGNAAPTSALPNDFAGKYVLAGGVLALRNDNNDGLVSRIGADPGAPVPDYFTMAGGTMATSAAGSMVMDSDRGMTVTANSGVRVNGPTSTQTVMSFNGTITGTSNVTMTKDGIGIFAVFSDNAETYQGNWKVDSGAIRANAPSGAPFGTGTITLNGSMLSFTPSNAFGTVNMAVGSLVANEGSIVNLAKGDGVFMDVTAGTLVRGARSTILIQASSGIEAGVGLGSAERLLVTGGVTTVNGIVPAAFGTRSTASTSGTLLGYDATNGFVPATYTSTDANDPANNNTSIVDVTGGTTLTANRAAFGVRVGGGNTLNLGGNTLTVGDGTAAASVVMNSGSNVTNGTLAFGASQGAIYFEDTVSDLQATITGTNGVTFVSANLNSSEPLKLTGVSTYSGPTAIVGGTVRVNTNNALPIGTAVSVQNNAQFALNTNVQQTVASINMDRNSQLNLGDSGQLTISGPGTSEIPVIPGGSVQSRLIATNGAQVLLGTANNNSANNNSGDPHGPLPSGAGTYNRLTINNGAVVTLSSQLVLPAATNGVLIADSISSHGGTLKITSVNSALQHNSLASLFDIATPAARRGLVVGASGARIWITEPEELVRHRRGAGVLATDVAALISGSGTLTLQGPGIDNDSPSIYAIGVGNTGFTGKWVADNVNLQFVTDGQISVAGVPQPGFNALGANLASYVADAITLRNGGGLQSEVLGNITANRGITVGSGGGFLHTLGGFTINSPLSGTGSLRLIGGTGSIALNAASPNYSGDFNVFSGGLTVGATNALGVGGTVRILGNGGSILAKTAASTVTLPNNIDFGSVGTAGSVDILTGASGDFTLAGSLSGSAPITVSGTSAASTANLVLTGNNSAYSGHIAMLEGASIVVASNTALGSAAGGVVMQPSSFLFVRGNINNTIAKNITMAGSLFNTSGNNVFKANITLAGDPLTSLIGADAGSIELGYIRGSRDLTIDGIGDGTVKADYVRVNALSVSANDKLEIVGNGTLASRVTSLTLGAGATLNMTQNDLIVDYTGTSPIADLITAFVGGTILANGDAAGLPTYLAIAEATDLGLTDFGGLTVDDSAVLVKYTYVGDANLDGQVDALDYERVDLAIGNSGVFGTAQGDLNYDGTVDALDYEQIDLNIGNGVGSPLAAVTGGVFVPEPASLSVLALGAGLMARRRRA